MGMIDEQYKAQIIKDLKKENTKLREDNVVLTVFADAFSECKVELEQLKEENRELKNTINIINESIKLLLKDKKINYVTND